MAWKDGLLRAGVVASALGLSVVCLAGPAATRQATQSPAALKGQLEAALEAGDTAGALRLAPQVVEATEAEHVGALYAAARLHAGRDDPQLPPRGVDTILMIDTIHYVKDRTAYAKTLLPALAPGGRVVIIDYLPKPMSERPWGPPPEQQFPREQLDREMRAAGFEPAASYAFLPEQFFVVYVPSALGNTGRKEPV